MNEDPIAKVRDLNATAFADVLRSHPGILIRVDELRSWRPCRPSVTGTITGLEHLGTLTPLCTDGTVAWFLGRTTNSAFLSHAFPSYGSYGSRVADDAVPQLREGEVLSRAETVLLHGHVKNFQWHAGGSGAPPQPYSVEGKSTSSEPKATKRKDSPSAFSEAMDLLKDLFS